jgi:WD40 repeat protein
MGTVIAVTPATAAPVDHGPDPEERLRWPLPPGAIARLGSLRLRHESDVRSLAFSPDGKQIASVAEYDDRIRVWDPDTGKLLHEFHATGLSSRRNSDRTLAFTPDGRTIAAGVGADVCFWDVQSGREVRRFRGQGDDLLVLTFSRDQKTFCCGGSNNKLHQWDIASGKLVRSWDYFDGRQPQIYSNGHAAKTATLKAISPDGKTAVWLVEQWDEEKDGVAASQDGKHLRIWDVATGKDRYHLTDGFRKPVITADVVLSSDGRCVTAYAHGTGMIVWDTATGKKLKTLGGRRAVAVAYSPDGRRIAAINKEVSLTVWDLPSGKELWHCDCSHHWVADGLDRSLAFSPSGKTIALGYWKNVRLWDVESGKEAPSPEGHRGPVERVVFSPRDQRWISADAACVCEWDSVHRQASRHSLSAPNVSLFPTADSYEANLRISAPGDASLEIRELTTNKLLGELDEFEGIYHHGCFSTDGRTVAVLRVLEEKPGFVFFDVPSRKLRSSLTITDPLEEHLTLSEDGKMLAAVCSDQTVLLIDSFRGKIVRRLGTPRPEPREDEPRINLTDGAFSPGGEFLAIGTRVERPGTGRLGVNDDRPPDPPGLRVWHVATGRELLRFDNCLSSARFGRVVSLRFSPDNRSLAVALNFMPRRYGDLEAVSVPVVEVASGRLRRRFKGHTDEVNTVAFSADGKVLASGGDDTTVLLWDMTRLLGTNDVAREPAAERLRLHWSHLAGRDAEAAYDAILALMAMPEESVAFLAGRLQPAATPSQAQLAKWIADLDAAAFQVREEADAKLTALHELARPALKQALGGKVSVEARRRITELLAQVDAMSYPPALLQQLRAVEVLERIATPEARRVLEHLAAGASEAILTIEARLSLARMTAPR